MMETFTHTHLAILSVHVHRNVDNNRAPQEREGISENLPSSSLYPLRSSSTKTVVSSLQRPKVVPAASAITISLFR